MSICSKSTLTRFGSHVKQQRLNTKSKVIHALNELWLKRKEKNMEAESGSKEESIQYESDIKNSQSEAHGVNEETEVLNIGEDIEADNEERDPLCANSKGLVEARGESGTSESSTADHQQYDTQFFGFTPKSFSDSMYNAVLEYTYTCLQSAVQYMRDKYPTKVSEETAKQASEAILSQLTRAIDKAFDKFEVYLKCQICHIAPNVLLAEDSVHKTISYSAEQEGQLHDHISALEERITCAMYMNAYMWAELKHAEQVQHMYDQYTHFLDELDRQVGVPDLREALIFNSEKAAKIQALLDKIKQHTIPQLRIPPTDR